MKILISGSFRGYKGEVKMSRWIESGDGKIYKQCTTQKSNYITPTDFLLKNKRKRSERGDISVH